MTNIYGYNRKTQEEDQRILEAVRRHHEMVESKGYIVVMTSLCGSQNYDLDDEKSDIDTYSLILPSLEELALAREPYAGIMFAEDGHCNIKDIRLALNLLKKTSPNSIEYFTSKYKVYNPVYEEVLKVYLEDETTMWYMAHCNYGHMLYAMAGMAHQLTKRNMPAGKRFAHAVRLDNMQYHFLNSMNASAILEFRNGGARDLAMIAKRDEDETHFADYDSQCEQIADRLDQLKDGFELTDEQLELEDKGMDLIYSLQMKLFKTYLMETNK